VNGYTQRKRKRLCQIFVIDMIVFKNEHAVTC